MSRERYGSHAERIDETDGYGFGQAVKDRVSRKPVMPPPENPRLREVDTI